MSPPTARPRVDRPLPTLLLTAMLLVGVLAGLLDWFSRRLAVACLVVLVLTLVLGVLAQRRRDAGLLAELARLRLAEQEALFANRAKSEFLANMSHELRTPLNAVIGSADLLLDAPLEQDERHHVEVVNSSAESLLALINDILDFAKAEAGQLRLEAVGFRLRDLVRGVHDLLTPTARSKGIGLEVEVGEEVPDALHGDPTRLRQVLVNLVGNAVKFTSQGRVEIRVSAAGDGDDGRLRFAVRDTGIGISPTDQHRIFESFFQAESQSARRFAGTGLGLSISRALVSRMDGEMDFESERGVGSTFWFQIPLARARGEIPEALETQAGPEFDRGRFRVLVVDDNPVNRNLALSHLEKMGYGATAMGDGETALARLQAERFDAVLMDCQMPELDGYETARRWRRWEKRHATSKRTARVPILAVTAHAMPGEREKCLAAGMDDHLAKPYRGADLRQVLDRWLRPDGDGATDPGDREPTEGEALASDFEERIAALRRLGEETGRDLLGMAIAELSSRGGELLDQMRRAHEADEASILADAAHSSIASAGALGAARLVEQLRAVESRALDGDLEGIHELIDRVEVETNRFHALLSERDDHAPHR